jgi:hypothetical protein
LESSGRADASADVATRCRTVAVNSSASGIVVIFTQNGVL